MMFHEEYEKVLAKIDYVNSNTTLDDSEKVNIINSIILTFRKKQRDIEKPTLKSIVAQFYIISPDSMNILTRAETIRHARQVAMWAYYNYSSKSLGSIGLEFYNGKHVYDHSTVLHAVKKVEDILSVDKQFRMEIDHLTQHIEKYYSKYERKSKLKNEKTRNLSDFEGDSHEHSSSNRNENLQTSLALAIN